MLRQKTGTTTWRPDLGSIMYEYYLSSVDRGYIGQLVLPVFPTPDQTGTYPKIAAETILKLPDTRRAPGGAYNRGDIEWEPGTYNCKENGHEKPLDDSIARKYRSLFDAELVKSRICMDVILRTYEKRVADAVFNTTTWTVSNVTNEWDDATNATPKANVDAATETLRLRGVIANALIISANGFKSAMRTDEIRGHLEHTSPLLTLGKERQRQVLADYFGLKYVFVGEAVYDSADKGQDMVGADIWNDEYAMVCRVAEDPENLEEPCIGRTFWWEEDAPEIVTVEEYREEQIRSGIYRARQHTDESIVFAGAGVLLGNITTNA